MLKTQDLPGEGGEGPHPRGAGPLETLSGPQTPRRLSSPLPQNPRSAPAFRFFGLLAPKDY